MKKFLLPASLVFTVWITGQGWAQHPAGTAGGQAVQSLDTPQGQTPALQSRFPRYRLGPGDSLALNFLYTPDFNQSVVVQPDGYINLRGIGDVQVLDKTVPEVATAVRDAYTKILREPIITIELKDFEKPYFIAAGEVARPGKYDLRGNTTILQALVVAGDLKAQSRSSQVLLFRRDSRNLMEVRQINVKRMLKARDFTEDTSLRSGDIVFVPKRPLAKLDRFIPVPTLGLFLNPFSF
jgi:polysaccharide biosynthesis/export protein